jgi:transposase
MGKGKTQPRARRVFSDEFEAEAVRLCKVGDRSITQVAAHLDLTETTLREWVERTATDAGGGPPGALTSDERTELAQLRREKKRLLTEREILKNARRPRGRPACWSRNSVTGKLVEPGGAAARLLVPSQPVKNMVRRCLRTCDW